MSRILRASFVLLAFACLVPTTSAAATAEEFLNASVWYLDYEVTVTSNYQGSEGKWSTTSSLVRVCAGAEKFNLRSQGPGSISMMAMAGNSGSKMSAADAQNLSMRMMSMMDNTANWMAAGPAMDEGADENTANTPAMAAVTIEYTRVDTGKDLVNELGGKFDQTITTTINKGAGTVQSVCTGVCVLELNAAEKSYVFTAPIGFNAQGAAVKQTKVDVIQEKGGKAFENKSENDVSLDLFPSGLVIDNPEAGTPGGAALIRGTFDASTGKIAGEKSFAGHYVDGASSIPATIVIKYTLKTTPPPKK